jgi:polyhydroxyalkanoate synthase subunit PhaC
LIRYAPQTAKVHPEPLLIVPSWIMKYYILDLQPHNSLVNFLVGQGHTVYMLSWRNPDASDRDLTLDDYLRLGVFDALRAIVSLHGRSTQIHAAGYCLGGTLLAIAAAAQAPALKSLTLLAAQTDFSEPGELGLFVDESQIGYLDQITSGPGYHSGKQMAGSFQFLHSRELVWTRRMREYLMGEREQRSDLSAWNADTTRMPARMHHEYLSALYLHNALAGGSYRVNLNGAARAVSLADIRVPVFLVGTERDHISPWRSVYKLHHLCDSEITFVLTSGGHNAGIVSEPGHAGRNYRIDCRPARSAWVEAGEWLARAPQREGSWWPAWHAWLSARSSKPVHTKPIPAAAALGDAPGRYVMQRYDD